MLEPRGVGLPSALLGKTRSLMLQLTVLFWFSFVQFDTCRVENEVDKMQINWSERQPITRRVFNGFTGYDFVITRRTTFVRS